MELSALVTTMAASGWHGPFLGMKMGRAGKGGC
jgi:hypothetical protein